MSDQTPPAALRPLITLSARLGKDPMLTQGAGGNTSLKHDGVLWVKASGKWLGEAENEAIFVPVDLAGVNRRIQADETDPVSAEVIDFAATRGLRPSIETTLHALLPHNVVVHVHSVNTMAWAARADGEANLKNLLNGLNWVWVPYCRPGLPLTRLVAEVMQKQTPDILVIANHGLVLGADDCETAASLLAEIEQRLQLEPRPPRQPDQARLQALSKDSGYCLPRHDSAHRTATDPDNLRIALGGSLYPDHVVFLCSAATELRDGESFADVSTRYGGEPPLLLVPGAGVLVREALPAGGEEMAMCLALVSERIPATSEVVYLTTEEDAELLNWDAEKYRKSVAATAI